MKEAVSLRHQSPMYENILVVDWGISNVCNYHCSYCPAATNRGDFPFVPLVETLAFCRRVKEHYQKKLQKEVYFCFTGGEVTLFEDFLLLVRTLKEDGSRVGISSNGSRELKFWEEAKKYLAHISLSYHDEYTDLDHFIEVINTVKGDTMAHVNVMVSPFAFEKCIEAAYRIFEETDDITLDLQIVLRDFIEPYPYTEEQRQKILELSDKFHQNLKIRKERHGYRGLMQVDFSDETTQLIKPGDLITKEMHSWLGWKCHVGLELLMVDIHGNIFPSWCGDATPIGNIKDPVIHFPEAPHICTKEWCTGGIMDIMTTKYKVINQ